MTISSYDFPEFEKCQEKHLSGKQYYWRSLFKLFWEGSVERCPQLELVCNDRYIAFKIQGLPSHWRSNVAWIDPQELGIKTGFDTTTDLSGFQPLGVSPEWAPRDLTWIMLDYQSRDKMFNPVVSAYVQLCGMHAIDYKLLDGKVRHPAQQ